MKYLIFPAIAILFLSCSVIDGDFHEKNIELAKIQGEWEVERISGGFGGGTLYPTPEGYPVFIDAEKITVSIKNDEVKWFTDGELSIVHEIKYEERSSSKLTLLMKDRPKDQFNVGKKYLLNNTADNERLNLMDSCFDCFFYDLVRQ